MNSNEYLISVLEKYAPRSLDKYEFKLMLLKIRLKNWASCCYISINNSGSRAKGTAISIASDVDYFISLKRDCKANNGDLKSIYKSLFDYLSQKYNSVIKQNVSIRIIIDELVVDVTPGRKESGNTDDHWIYVSKKDTWKKTNIQKHINDVSKSDRLNEIKLLKIWRELHGLDFPSIYLEYLAINCLSGKSKDASKLWENFYFLLNELAKETNNPLYRRIVDPANTANILSELLTLTEKKAIISKAKSSIRKKYWDEIVW